MERHVIFRKSEDGSGWHAPPLIGEGDGVISEPPGAAAKAAELKPPHKKRTSGWIIWTRAAGETCATADLSRR
jgi:hypothetical protein